MKELRLRDHRVEKFEWKEVEVLIKQAFENLEKLKEVLERILLHDGSAPASILGYYLDDLDGYCSIFCPLGYKPYKEIGHEIRTNSKALEGAIETGLMCAAIHTHVGAALDVWENWDCMKSGILRIVNDPILKVHIEWIGTWLEVYIIPNVSPITLSRYQGMIKRYIKPIIGHMQVQQRNTLAVQAWVNGLKISPSSGKPMAAATVKHA